ncbi:pentapeptide repeat-containing protein [Helicobacter colisuis]|uniref:Pentapeptide repeat-containing protein n=1 Tax=Helicobacter colisuis TaxID=2949739 RepID=A0ABT0TRW9_9HELI|nr:pentapeptide repeat-containing protein [Helicobacter colisuis]MCL9818657.1 pentapeptide repeat-containing protein [Helicobacter colisuis]
MKHLTKEQEQEIWDKVSKEVENFDTFLDKSQCIDEICRKIKSISEGMVQLSWTTLDETLKRTKEITYECIGTKEIQDVFGKDFSIQYSSDTFCIMPKPKIQPYNENQQDSKDAPKQDMKDISCFKLPILLEKYPLLFMNCVFHCEFLNTDFTKDLKKLCFMQCEFKEKITLNFKECLDVFQMSYCTFEKPLTIHGKFKENADFNNSTFKDSADFHECEFEKTACFYGVKFDKAPNFSQTQFKGSLNAVNTKLDFGFESLKEKIKQEPIKYNERKSVKKPLAHFANDFRDSFRVFKNALIKDNNLLDASNFHKYELYCKEIELDSKKTKTLKDKVEKWQLWFYRKLCDHHTDLVLNLKWLIIAIGLFACLYFIAKVFQNINILNILSPLGVFLSILSFLILFCMCYCKCIKIFDFFAYLSVIPTLWVICYKPKLIFGIANLVGNKNYNGFENALITIYTILLALVLFSLQKTARKNSIVPN